MEKTLMDKGKLYDADGETYICDARYVVYMRPDRDGRQNNTGMLYDIDSTTLARLHGGYWILKLKDGQALNFAATGLDMMARRLDIQITTVINDRPRD